MPARINHPDFWQNVTPTGFCWEWGGTRNDRGYGTFSSKKAHRVAYELLVGPIGRGLTLDHLCRTRHCVNPDHLEPVTQGENSSRAVDSISAGNRRRSGEQTHCKHGHEYTQENTYRSPRGWRRCRQCHRAESTRRYLTKGRTT